MSFFAPLHVRSGYSFLQSGLTIEKIKNSIKKNDYFGCGLADLNNLHGLHEFLDAMKAINKPCALGMEILLDNNSISLFIKNEVGYRNLLKINYAIQKEELTLETLKEHSEGLIAIIETKYGDFKEQFDSLEELKFAKYLINISEIYMDDFYLGVEITSKDDIVFANKVREFASKFTYKTIAFPRIKYVGKNDAIVIDILNAIRDESIELSIKKKEGQEYFWEEKLYQKVYTNQEIESTTDIIKQSEFNLDIKRGTLLKLSNHPGEDLTEKCYKSLLEKKLKNEEYETRLDYELSVIDNMGYSNYFLLVQDYINHARNRGIVVGPGRGSAAGSLVSYLLGITEVDPLKYNLSFERFLNPNRKTMPDIDVDFMDIKREEVVEYVRHKYGQNKVANIATFQRIMAKQSLRDIQRVYKYPENHINKLCKSLPKQEKDQKEITLAEAYKKGGPFKELVDSDKYFIEIVGLASKIEGLPRQSGMHAAGIVINNEPLDDVLPVNIDFSGNYITQFEMGYLEQEGFLKMDFLSLRNLTVIDLAVKLINLHHKDAKLIPESIPFDTPEAIDIIKNRHTMGVFQLESAGMKRAIKILKPTTFDDIVALIALFRPGPMDQIKDYADKKEGKKKITYISNALESILSSTYGVIIYQEQVSKIAEVMAGFTPGEADVFRRAISKKVKEKILSAKTQFISGSIKNGYSEKEANDVFNLIVKFANYGFNKSHSVVYSMIACRLAYLKAHYPLEFYSAILQIGSSVDDSKFNEYITELKARNFKVYPPNINESELVFTVKQDGLLFPLSSIHGVNLVMNQNILLEREKGKFVDLFDFVTRMYEYKISENQVLALINSGALDSLNPSRATMRVSLKGAMQFAQLNHSETGQLSMGIMESLKPALTTMKDDPLENLDLEYETIGIMLSDNPLRYKKDILDNKGATSIIEIEDMDTCVVAGIIKSKKNIATKKGDTMSYVKIFDETGEIEVTVFPRVYNECYAFLEKNKTVLVSGKIQKDDEDLAILADQIELLED